MSGQESRDDEVRMGLRGAQWAVEAMQAYLESRGNDVTRIAVAAAEAGGSLAFLANLLAFMAELRPRDELLRLLDGQALSLQMRQHLHAEGFDLDELDTPQEGIE